MTITAPTGLQNNRGGSGKYVPLRKRSSVDTISHFEDIDNLVETLDDIDKRNIRTIFKQAKDPVYLAYEHIDRQPLNKLAKDFVKETAMDFVEFVAKIFE